MKWLKEWIRNWLEVDKSPYFATDEEIWNSQVNMWEFMGSIDADEAKKLRAETHKSDKLREQAEPRLEAGEGLDVTACSASSFVKDVALLSDTLQENQMLLLLRKWERVKLFALNRDHPKSPLNNLS